MQIPEDLRHFPEAALIVLTDEQHARFLLAGGDSCERLDGFELPREKLSDNEGSFVSSDGSRVGGPGSDLHDTPRKEKFAKAVSEAVTKNVREHRAEKIYLISPPEMLHRIGEHLSNDAQPHIAKTLAKDLTNEDDLEVIRRLFTLPD